MRLRELLNEAKVSGPEVFKEATQWIKTNYKKEDIDKLVASKKLKQVPPKVKKSPLYISKKNWLTSETAKQYAVNDALDEVLKRAQGQKELKVRFSNDLVNKLFNWMMEQYNVEGI